MEESRITGEMVYRGTLLACAEMLLSGTTCFCDMYLVEQEVARAAAEVDMRAVVGEILYDFRCPCYGSLDKGFDFVYLSGVAVTPVENDAAELAEIMIKPDQSLIFLFV